LTGCNAYDPELVQGSRSRPVESAVDATAASECDLDCKLEHADASAPATVCEADAAAHGCEPAAEISERRNLESARDECPVDPEKTLPGTCGCGEPDVDSDADGTLDCEDGCPQDPLKTAARICGCGTADADSDSDGSADCVDACPRDASKTSVGACGCGASDDDQDGDGTADCVDICPQDRSKTSAGICGCGSVDPTTQEHAQVYCTKRWLLHRYSFEAGETFASDRVGAAHATIVLGDAVTTPGALTLSGDKGAGSSAETYVTLPRSAWPQGNSATFEAWVTWKGAATTGPAIWQRVFDFGDQRAGKGNSFVALTPDGAGGVRTTFSTGGSEREVFVITNSPLPQNVIKHLAVVVDGASGTLSLYIDGRAQGSVGLPDQLSNIAPANLWLGRSNFDIDPAFFGSLHEFRIYGEALTEAQLGASYAAGADYAFSP
jgi:hypothetical protein